MTELRDFIVAGRVVRLTTAVPHERPIDVDLSQVAAVPYEPVSMTCNRAGLFTLSGDFLGWLMDDDTFRAAWKRECGIRDTSPGADWVRRNSPTTSEAPNVQ